MFKLNIATTKQKIIISKIRKNCPLKPSYIVPLVLERMVRVNSQTQTAEEIRCVFDDNSKIIFVKSS